MGGREGGGSEGGSEGGREGGREGGGVRGGEGGKEGGSEQVRKRGYKERIFHKCGSYIINRNISYNASLLTMYMLKCVPAPLSVSFSMCSGFPWKADHMRGVIMAPSLKLASRPGTCMGKLMVLGMGSD